MTDTPEPLLRIVASTKNPKPGPSLSDTVHGGGLTVSRIIRPRAAADSPSP